MEQDTYYKYYKVYYINALNVKFHFIYLILFFAYKNHKYVFV